MTLVVGENTWGTEIEADEYFSTRLGSTLWPTGTSEKEIALISAFRETEAFCDWNSSFDRDDPAEPVKFAQFEIAYQLLEKGSVAGAPKELIPGIPISAGQVTAKVSSLNVSFTTGGASDGTELFTDKVNRLLAPYCEVETSSYVPMYKG